MFIVHSQVLIITAHVHTKESYFEHKLGTVDWG